MSIQAELLSILVCPESRTPLTEASTERLSELNGRIAAGDVKTLGGKAVEEPLVAGLVREDGTRMYPIVDGIPVLLAEDAIPLV